MLNPDILLEAYNVGLRGHLLHCVEGIRDGLSMEDCRLLVHAKALRELPPDRFDTAMRTEREGFLMALVYAWLAGIRLGR